MSDSSNPRTQWVEFGRHRLHIADVGDVDGTPVVVVHGGPGTGNDLREAQIFDLKRCRVLLPDQRGTGKSAPNAAAEKAPEGLRDNTTRNLIEDMRRIKTQLGVHQPWVLAGHSFGAALSMAYALTYPTEVRGLILSGTLLCRDSDFEYLFGPQGFAASQRADAYREFLEHLSPEIPRNPVQTYTQLAWNKVRAIREDAAWEWVRWNTQLYYTDPRPEPERTPQAVTRAVNFTRLMQHYMQNRMFLFDLFGPSPGNNQLLENAARLPDVPIRIVHGALDLATPVAGAQRLQAAINASPRDNFASLTIVQGASHSSSEPGQLDAMRSAAEFIYE